jgi:hypothetical protein
MRGTRIIFMMRCALFVAASILLSMFAAQMRIAMLVFVLAEILSETWSGRDSLKQNLLVQLDLFGHSLFSICF